MSMKRLIAAVAVITFLMMGTVSPKPAQALSAGEILIITGAAIVGWVAFVVIATQVTFRKKIEWSENAADRPVNGMHAPQRVHFGADCHPTSAEASPVLCW